MATEFKGTPGSWQLSASGLTVTDGRPDATGGFPGGRPVAYTSPYHSPAERQANARLIRACPAMLAALERAAVSLGWLARDCPRTPDDLLSQIEDVIREAKGE